MVDIVYVLTNEGMPDLVKIGLTQDSIESRISSLSAHSGVPFPFECYYAAEVDDCKKLEKTLHQLFSEARVNPKREFFKLDPEKVVLALSIGNFKEVIVGDTQVDKDEKVALEKAKLRRPKLKLSALGIGPGDVLVLSRDEDITCEVVENGNVLFRQEIMSLSAAALSALHSLGYTTPTASGPGYWMFDGELLDERRRRMEAAQFDDSSTND